jgi:hypothetical protein
MSSLLYTGGFKISVLYPRALKMEAKRTCETLLTVYTTPWENPDYNGQSCYKHSPSQACVQPGRPSLWLPTACLNKDWHWNRNRLRTLCTATEHIASRSSGERFHCLESYLKTEKPTRCHKFVNSFLIPQFCLAWKRFQISQCSSKLITGHKYPPHFNNREGSCWLDFLSKAVSHCAFFLY